MSGPVDETDIPLAGLLRVCEPPAPVALAKIVQVHGPLAAWEAISRRGADAAVMRAVGPRLADLDADELRARALADLAAAADAGACIIGPGDEDWPLASFAPLEFVAPFDGSAAAAAPLALYRRGGVVPTGAGRAVSIVGSRAATAYGVRVASEIAAEAVWAGYDVISGAAFGIDAAAHRAAVHARGDEASIGLLGTTVAVLACGIDRAYPAAHRGLIDGIAGVGSVVSEYPPGAAPARHRFLVRNRIIAALSQVTVVVEAGRRSGSLNTATTAAAASRQVVAIPGPVTSAMSVGCHEMIMSGKATLATRWADIVPLLDCRESGPPVHHPGGRPTDGLDLVAAQVHDAFPARPRIVTVDALAAEAGLSARDVLGGLATLQLDGLAERVDGGWRRLTPGT